MKLVHIFGPDGKEEEGVWALKYEGKPKDELRAIFDLWLDPEYMDQFCQENLELIRTAFGKPVSLQWVVNALMDEAEELYDLLFALATRTPPGTHLQELFKPLHNADSRLTVLQLSKGSIRNQTIKNPKLRIYAIRIAGNAYVVTGGAIKLTRTMAEGVSTSEQLRRLLAVRDWLKDNGICYADDLNDLI
jgi:hypothetical protein